MSISMKLYEFQVDGASPGPGVVVVQAWHKLRARDLAMNEVREINEDRKMSGLVDVRLGELLSVKERKKSAVVYTYDGER